MKPEYILIGVFVVVSIFSKIFTADWNIYFSGNLGMSLMLLLTATGHFLFSRGMAMMIPPFIPFKNSIVYLTGVIEIALAISLLFPATRLYTGYALIVFFMLILPANIYGAIHHIDLQKASNNGPGLAYLWYRVPMQAFYIGWLYYFSIRPY